MAEKLLKMKVRSRSQPSSLQPGRTIKMCASICNICQQGKAPDDWYKTCSHDPYTEFSEVTHRKRVTEVQEDGRVKVIGYEDFIEEEAWPNMFQVPYNPRIDSRKGVQMAQAGGCVFPQDRGWQPFCEYRDCWSQDIHIRNPQYGNYCCRDHAALSIADQQGKPLDVMDDERRMEQLSEINV